MDEFINEIKETPTSDLLLILNDQQDLYSKEEIDIIRKELASRPSNALELETKVAKAALDKAEERRQAEENEKKRQIALKLREVKLDHLKSSGYDGYYEYKVISITDHASGSVDPLLLESNMNHLALEGWRLRSAFTNEMGKTVHSSTVLGSTTETNATMDQNILVFERFVRFE